MGTLNGKILVGFVLNVALIIAFFSTEMADGGALAWHSLPLRRPASS